MLMRRSRTVTSKPRTHAGNIAHVLHGDADAPVAHSDLEAFSLEEFFPALNNRVLRRIVLLDHIEIDSLIFLRGQGQQPLRVLDQRDSFVRDFLRPGAMLFAAHNAQLLRIRNQRAGFLLFMQPQRGFYGENAGDRFVKTLLGQEPALDPRQQETVILVQILVEKDHVRSGGNSRGDRSLAGHGGGEG